MKAVILAGGLGSRIAEETYDKPKPMVPIGGLPILWHIMKIYSHYGIHEFVVCLGYKGYVIKDFFHHFYLHTNHVTYDLGNDEITYHDRVREPWKVTLVDTGQDVMTGARLKKVAPYIDEEPFLMTYGDGVGDVPIDKLVQFHKDHGKIATRYGGESARALWSH